LRKLSPTTQPVTHSLTTMAPSGPPAKKADPKAAAAKPKAEKKKEEPRPEDLVPKVEPVNDKDFETRLEKVQENIEKLQVKQKDLNTKIKERSGGKDEHQTQRVELRQQLDKWSALMDDIKAKKDGLTGQIGDAKKEALEMKDSINKMKKTIGYTSEEAIDKRMRDIEYDMSHNVISLKVEKEYMKELAQLKKNRPGVHKVNAMEAGLAGASSSAPIKEQIKALNEEMASYFLEKKKVSEQLKELNELRQKVTGDLPDLIAQREELSKKIQEQIKERNDVRW